ncbi:hypothetical protein R84981_002898 [Carnimonas sp. R-84981]|uniref:phage tail assembly chaperone n=1 Tax=Carnimonas bestiolae TaxID=3402172 RepID=UPI003EDC0BD3
MSRRFDIEIDGERYHGDTASAKDQSKALRIATQTQLIASLAEDIPDVSLVVAFNSIPEDDANELIRLLVSGRVLRSSDNVEVAENLFGDSIHNWSLLVGKVLKENVGPFWTLIGQSTTKADQVPMS